MSENGRLAVSGTFFDGETADRHQSRATIEDDRLIVRGPGNSLLANWPLSAVREARDHGWEKALVIFSKDDQARLVVTGPYAISEMRNACPNLRKSSISRSELRRVGLWTGGAVATICLMLFVIIPGMANQLARFIPPEREAAFGASVIAQLESFLGGEERGSLFCEDPDGIAALELLTRELVGARELNYDLSVRVMNHDMVNAFAVPGGQVVIMRGLIDAVSQPDEVAAVLAHEIGHVVARDPTRAALRAAGSAGILGMVLGDFTGGTIAVVVADQMMQAQYAQTIEAEADDFAIEMLRDARISPHALASLFVRFDALHQSGEGFELPEAFQSHPDLPSRIAKANKAGYAGDVLSFRDKPVIGKQEWAALRGICGKA